MFSPTQKHQLHFTKAVYRYHLVTTQSIILPLANPAYNPDSSTANLPPYWNNGCPENFSLALFLPVLKSTPYHLPFLHNKHEAEEVTSSLHEFVDAASNPFFYDNILFPTREHAFYYCKLLYLREAIFAAGDREREEIDKFMDQLTISQPQTLGVGQDMKAQVNLCFDRLCENKIGIVNEADTASGLVNQRLKSGWAALSLQSMRSIWSEYCQQYPAVKILLLQLWEQGILPVDANENALSWSVECQSRDDQPWQWFTTELLLRLIFDWKNLTFPEAWFAELKSQFNGQWQLTRQHRQHHLHAGCVSSGKVPIDYYNFPVATHFASILVDEEDILEAKCYSGASPSPKHKGQRAQSFFVNKKNRHTLAALLSDCHPSQTNKEKEYIEPFKLFYVRGKEHRNHGQIKFLFILPALATTFRQRFAHCYGLSQEHIFTENIMVAGLAEAHPAITAGYRFSVSVAVVHPQQLDEFMDFSKKAIFLFPHFGAACWQLIGDLLQQDIAQTAEKFLAVSCTVNALHQVKDHLLSPNHAVNDLISYYSFMHNLVKNVRQLSPLPLYIEQRMNVPFFRVQIFGRDDFSHAKSLLHALSQSKMGTHHSDANSQLNKENMTRLLTDYCQRFQSIAPPLCLVSRAFDYHHSDEFDLLSSESIHLQQQSVKIVTWGDVAALYQKFQNDLNLQTANAVPAVSSSTTSSQFLLHGLVNHLLDEETGVYHRHSKRFFIFPSEPHARTYLTSTRRWKTLVFSPIISEFPLSQQTRFYDDNVQRYQALLLMADQLGIHWLSMTLEGIGSELGELRQMFALLKAKALIEAISTTTPNALKTIFIAAPVINQDAFLYRTLVQQFSEINQLAMSISLIIVDTLPSTLSHFVTRYLANIKMDDNPAEVVIAEVITDQAVSIPSYSFSLTPKFTPPHNPSFRVDTTAALTFHPALNPKIYAQHSTYETITLPPQRAIPAVALDQDNAVGGGSAPTVLATSNAFSSATTTGTLPKDRSDDDVDDKAVKRL